MRSRDHSIVPIGVRGLIVLGAACGILGLFPVAEVGAAVSAPAWRVVSLSAPTEFSAADSARELNIVEGNPAKQCRAHEERSSTCDQFDIRVVNVGGAPAGTPGEPIVVTDTLPPGLTTQDTPHSALSRPNLTSTEIGWTCGPAGSGQRLVSCEYNLPVPALGQLPPIDIPVQVGTVAPNSLLTNTVTVSGGGAHEVSAGSQVLVEPSASPLFGVAELENYLADPAGAPATEAAGHPNALYTSLALNTVPSTEGVSQPAGQQKNLVVELPLGLIGDPLATPRCPLSLLPPQTLEAREATPEQSGCPADTRVGMVTFSALGGEYFESYPIYNLVPDRGHPAEFGFTYIDQRVILLPSIARTAMGYTILVSVPGTPELAKFQGAEVTFFGDPAREDNEGEGSGVAFLRAPSNCTGQPLLTTVHADAWEDPAQVSLNPDGSPDLNAANFSEPQWKGIAAESSPVTGCQSLTFEPSLDFQPSGPEDARAASPAGYTAELKIPQENLTDPETPATPDLKKAVVTLPEGLVADPSFAGGLASCSESQIGLDDTAPPTCPPESRVGAVEVLTPLLEHPLPGSVYLAAQGENPFHSLLALYLVVDDPETGVIVKLPGEVNLNPSTGRITATFDDNPQFPFEKIKLVFEGGSRAPLTNPDTCGAKRIESQLTPWSSTTPFVTESVSEISSGPGGSACVNTPAEEPNRPGFTAGTTNPAAGAYSPFVLKLTREDGSQTFKGLDVTLPPGLIGKLAGITECPQVDLETAEHTSGRAELAAPSCPSNSEVGTVDVGAGSGTPFHVQGHAYLAGPYNGAPFSLAIVTPAVAGPFDIGTVLVRSALYINPETAQVTVKSDPIPTILDGIPLDVKSIAVYINRSGFTLNPTNCAPMTIAGVAITSGSEAPLSEHFQVGNCAALPFAPSFAASTQAQTSKADGASLVVKVAQKPGEANIHKVDIQLPLALPARLTTLQKACTEAQFNVNPAGCPGASDIGTAIAVTPLLSSPLTGPAYLVSHGGAAFPDVEFVLQGEGVQVDLDGKTDIKKGITFSRFETVPDAPISSFVTTLPEGPHSALAANENLCNRSLSMPTTLAAQNGKQLVQNTTIEVEGCSNAIVITSHTIRGSALALAVRVPAAGRLTASGRGLSRATRSSSGRETLKLTLHKKARAGRLSTTVRLSFVPSRGAKQSKTLKASFKS